MTTWYVQAGNAGGNGSQPAPFATLAKAAALAGEGDEIIIGDGVYREVLRPPKGTTWRAADGATPVIDGGWNGKALPATQGNANQVLVREAHVTLIGLTVRNVPGRGITVAAGGDFFTAEDCVAHDTFQGGMGVNGTGTRIKRPVFRRCTTYRTSRSWETRQGGVNGNFLFRYVDDGLVEDCTIIGTFGEAIAAGVETGRRLPDGTEVPGLTIRNCTIHTAMHLLCYASNRARNVLVSGCLLYQTGDPYFKQGDGDVGGGLVVGDELPNKGRQNAENVVIEDCLIVNTTGLGVRNNIKPGRIAGNLDGYQTTIQNLVFRRNTVIAGPNSKQGVIIDENPRKPPAVKALIEDCVFVFDAIPNAERAWMVDARGVSVRNCAFSPSLPKGVGAQDNFVVPIESLTNALADVTGTAESHSFSVNNYRPVPGSVIAKRALGAFRAIEGPEPPVEPPDPPVEPPDPPVEPEPPEPEPDWDALLGQAADVGVQLATMAEAAEQRRAMIEQLKEEDAVLSLALDQATAELGELLLKLEDFKSAA